jgi:hypothetical protein
MMEPHKAWTMQGSLGGSLCCDLFPMAVYLNPEAMTRFLKIACSFAAAAAFLMSAGAQ